MKTVVDDADYVVLYNSLIYTGIIHAAIDGGRSANFQSEHCVIDRQKFMLFG